MLNIGRLTIGLISCISASAVFAVPNFYTVDVETDELVQVDASTGHVSVVGELGYDAVDVDLVNTSNGLRGINTIFGIRVDLLEIDYYTGAIANTALVQSDTGPILHAEGLAAINDQLIVSYSPSGGVNSSSAGELSQTGLITSSFDLDLDADGLWADSESGVIFALDRRLGQNVVDFRSLTEISPNSSFLGNVPSTFLLTDLVILNNLIYAIDLDQEQLIIFNIGNGESTVLPMDRPGRYSGLAIIPEPSGFILAAGSICLFQFLAGGRRRYSSRSHSNVSANATAAL